MTSAKKDGLCLVAVTFNDRDDWQDHIDLYEYGFGKYSGISSGNFDDVYKVNVLGGEKDYVSLVCGDFNLVIPKESSGGIRSEVLIAKTVFAPINKGDTLGILSVYNDETLIYQGKLCADEDVSAKSEKYPFLFFRNLFYRIFK